MMASTDLTFPPGEGPRGLCMNCNGPLTSNLGLCEAMGCHRLCKGCGHEVWEHNPNGCLHADFVGDYGEHNQYCVCALSITNVPYGTHTQEHYEATDASS